VSATRAQEHAKALQIEVPGGTVPVWIQGSGPPVVLLHGLSANHTEWSAVANQLGARYTVVLTDLLGRGSSVPDRRARFALTDEVERVGAVLDALSLRDPLLAGHSNGATLALALASRVPCRRVVMFSPVTPWTRRPPALDLLRWRPVRTAVRPVISICRRPLTRYILTRRVYGDRPPPIEDAVRRFSDPYANGARGDALLRILADWQPARLAALSAPADVALHVVAGEQDRRIAPDLAEAWARRIGAEFTLVRGAGHGLTEERPELCAEILG
jgi:pimeloyl-ACP methyl ester carboxylesterase